MLQIHASRLQQNNNFAYIYVKNNNFIPHNLIYIKRIYYMNIFDCIVEHAGMYL